MSSTVVFLLGAAGALAPEIVRLYGIRQDPDRFQWSWFYVVVSLMFAGLGGLLALALPATTHWGALYVGVSTPVLINSLVRKGREISRQQVRAPRPVRHSLVDSYVNGL